MSLLKRAPANLAYLGGGMIVAVRALEVFVGGANAGDYPLSKSTKAPSIQAHQKTEVKS
ncbi:hypothetical protein [Synechococcus sp. MU1643]|uniref:hypothetical protein n=1 Tax=Synechococcus sp. MU1643 TaxID=2508349 RepID=UPI001CF9097E|nr:hypothetical protein [Synechococcus sp. MU1643]